MEEFRQETQTLTAMANAAVARESKSFFRRYGCRGFSHCVKI